MIKILKIFIKFGNDVRECQKGIEKKIKPILKN